MTETKIEIWRDSEGAADGAYLGVGMHDMLYLTENPCAGFEGLLELRTPCDGHRSIYIPKAHLRDLAELCTRFADALEGAR